MGKENRVSESNTKTRGGKDVFIMEGVDGPAEASWAGSLVKPKSLYPKGNYFPQTLPILSNMRAHDRDLHNLDPNIVGPKRSRGGASSQLDSRGSALDPGIATIWLIWKFRCKFVFDKSDLHLNEVVAIIRHVVRDCEATFSVRDVDHNHGRCVNWLSPGQGHLKLNTDGAVDRSSKLVGMAGFLTKIGIADTLMAELWGVREDLLLAKKCGARKIEIESDSNTLVKYLSLGVEEGNKYFNLIMDCHLLMQEVEVTLVKARVQRSKSMH
ncbi:Ribonuclease H domain [Dillenia turbinata]|uniref:Ribonuclease H domain n=1 Tax=Dillenia turbinata TaxID=194707 RepID=A0AAN8Z0Y2_9MAGN